MFIQDLKDFLEKLDSYRDKLLFMFIKPYWPRFITPNHLSYLRIIIGVTLFILLFLLGIENKILIILLFIIGALTDLFDGSVARGLNQETAFGAKIDPIADRFLIVPIAVASLFFNHLVLLLWLGTLEIFNTLVSLCAHFQHLSIKHNIFWKIKFFMYSVVFITILIFWPAPPHQFFIGMLWMSTIFGVISIILRMKKLKHAT